MVVACLNSTGRGIVKPLANAPQSHNANRSMFAAPFPKLRAPLTASPPRHAAVVVRAGKIREVTEQELEVAVANRDRPMIIDFFATWCGPCVLLAKELEQVAEQLGDKIEIIKIDCDKNEAISGALQIQGLPTLIFVGMDANKPALRTEGLLPAQAIIDIVEKDLMAPTQQ